MTGPLASLLRSILFASASFVRLIVCWSTWNARLHVDIVTRYEK